MGGPTAKPKIQIGYRAKSDDPDRCCEKCFYFQPVPDSEDDGRCFGTLVSAQGLCQLFTSKSDVERSFAEQEST